MQRCFKSRWIAGAAALVVLLLAGCSSKSIRLGQTAAGGSDGTAGSGGQAGTGGSGGVQAQSDKVDLLFVVDNSLSMEDKQQLLSFAVDDLLERMVNPRCVNAAGTAVAQPKSPDIPCPSGSQREHTPARDLHVGVITSSLGAQGGDICSPSYSNFTPPKNDRAHLLGTVRSNIPSFNDQGFLWWHADGANGATSDVPKLVADTKAHITSAGENGCGYEMPLEAMYRFLVDPEPPENVTTKGNLTEVSGIDQVLLAQRQAFLRPESAVFVVLLSDENDCSIRNYGPLEVHKQGWLVTSAHTSSQGLPRATAICKTKPSDPCCRNCAATNPPGCQKAAEDPECSKGPYHFLEDHLNLRCWDQKRRFGVDWLLPHPALRRRLALDNHRQA